jgi:hypothetical protein
MRRHASTWSRQIRIPSGQRYRRLSRWKLNRLNSLVGSGQVKWPISFWMAGFQPLMFLTVSETPTPDRGTREVRMGTVGERDVHRPNVSHDLDATAYPKRCFEAKGSLPSEARSGDRRRAGTNAAVSSVHAVTRRTGSSQCRSSVTPSADDSSRASS